MVPISALATLRFTVAGSMRAMRSTNFFWDRRSRRWLIVYGDVFYQADIVLIHDPNLFGDPMHLTVKALKI